MEQTDWVSIVIRDFLHHHVFSSPHLPTRALCASRAVCTAWRNLIPYPPIHFSRNCTPKLKEFLSLLNKTHSTAIRAHQLRSEALIELANALANNSTLIDLDVGFYALKPPTIDAWAEAVRRNKSIRYLTLHCGTPGPFNPIMEAFAANNTISSLTLSIRARNEQIEALATSLAQNTTLTYLDLTGNEFGDIGATALARVIRANTTLISLNLARNIIADEGATAIANSIRINSTLRSLSLSSNGIRDAGMHALAAAMIVNRGLVDFSCDLNADTLEGSKAIIRMLPEHLALRSINIRVPELHANLAQIVGRFLAASKIVRSASIDSVGLEEDGLKHICEALKQNSSVEDLKFQLFATVSAVGFASIGKMLRVNHSIRNLDLSRSFLEYECWRALAAGLKGNQSLRSLNLTGTTPVSDGMHALMNAISTHTSLSELLLEDNEIDDSVAQILFSKLANHVSLSDLSLESNKIQDEGISYIAQCLMENTSLRRLHLNRNEISGRRVEAFKELANALKVNKRFLSLDLSEHSLEEDSVVALLEAQLVSDAVVSLDYRGPGDKWPLALAELFKANRPIEMLRVDSMIGSGPAKALAESLRSNIFISWVEIETGMIGDEGVVAFAEVLKTNHVVRGLLLPHNSITAMGASSLARMLEVNQTLTTLDLTGNKIGSSGGIALAESLRHNSTLTSLTLNSSTIGDDATIALAKTIEMTTTLMNVGLVACDIGDSGALALVRAVKLSPVISRLSLSLNARISRDVRSKFSDTITDPAVHVYV